MGLMLAARRAGTQQATRAISNSVAEMNAMSTGSRGLTW
jgi:hypothetical protein